MNQNQNLRLFDDIIKYHSCHRRNFEKMFLVDLQNIDLMTLEAQAIPSYVASLQHNCTFMVAYNNLSLHQTSHFHTRV